jgi:helicase-like protein/SNF2 domain-containing protein
VLARFGGVLVADGVGLGKTFIALALAALERRAGGDAVALVPAALRSEWRDACGRTGVQVPLLTHTSLAGTAPTLPPRCSLLLVDEAHAFRNARTRRYATLADLSVGRRIALLSATPYNNGPADLTSLIALFAGRDRFRELGVADIRAALRHGDARAAQLALGAVSVCRTRRLVEERWPALRSRFPRRVLRPPLRYDLDAVYGGRLREVLDALDAVARVQGAAEGAGALLHLTLLRRLESGAPALRATLRRQRLFVEEAMRAAADGVPLTRRTFRRAFHGSEAPGEQLLLWSLLERRSDVATPHRFATLHAALVHAEEVTAVGTARGVSAKRAALDAFLDGLPAGARTIVFTEHADTARELLSWLRRRRRVLAVMGTEAWAGTTRVPREEALDAFAPMSRGCRPQRLLEADVLVATDVASEGLNLQDASFVVNYDLPWNPVRVMQRVGRVDRLGSPHHVVHVAHCIPTGGLASLAGVLERLRAKIGAAPLAPTAEPDPLAALWWMDAGLSPESLEREGWRRVAPFEACERWRAFGQRPAGALEGPVVAGAVARDGCTAGLAIVLVAAMNDGRRIPLPFLLTANGAIREDAHAVAEVAMKAATAEPAFVEPGMMTSALGAVLPLAQRRLAELNASQHGVIEPGPGRAAALVALEQVAARAHRGRSDTAAIDAARRTLRFDVSAGVDATLGRMADANGVDFAASILRIAGQPLDAGVEPRAPHLELVAAIVVAAHDATRAAPRHG